MAEFINEEAKKVIQITKKENVQVHIRWMIRPDMPEVLAIESQSSESPWSEEDFINCLRQRNRIGMVAEHDERVVGFMIYELNKTRIRVLNFAVAKAFRRRGAGTQMVQKLIGKLSTQRRSRINVEIKKDYENEATRLFLIANRFRVATKLNGGNGCLMQFRYNPDSLPGQG